MNNTYDDFPNVYKVLTEFGEKTVEEMKAKLKKAGKKASGKLYDSISYQIVENEETQELSIQFGMEDYGEYVNEGRKPGSFPPLQPIKRWLKIKKIPQEAAYPIAQKIKREGVEPTYFMLISNTKWNNFQKKLATAYEKDLDKLVMKAFKQ